MKRAIDKKPSQHKINRIAKLEVSTVGELRAALKNLPDDTTFQCLFDGADYRELEVEVCYPNEPDARFVRFTLP